MSMLQDQQQHPLPSLTVTQLSPSSYSSRGSVAPFIVVLVLITVLGALSAIVGRLCSGRRIMGYGQYDVESWLEEKCSSCIDGRLSQPPPPSAVASAGSAPPSIPSQTHEEKREPSPSPQNPRPHGGS